MIKYMRGYAAVEFAMVGAVFFVVLFGIFEVGRLLFFWNTLTEATRRGARMAIVCPIQHQAIIRSALFREENNNNSIVPNMTVEDFTLEYLDQDGFVLSSPVNSYLSIRFVRVSVASGKQVQSLIPGVTKVLELPSLATTLPIESMGVSRDSATSQCQGSAQ